MTSALKWCRYCERMLAQDLFHIRRASADGLNYKCKECQRAWNRQCYLKEPQKAKDKAAQWAARNPARRRAIRLDWDRCHVEQKRIYARRWRSEINPERSRVLNLLGAHRRRISGRVTAQQWRLLVQLARGCCVYCGKLSKLTLDHLVSVKNGGLTCWENCVPACRSCNSSKNASDGPDWAYNRFGLAAGRVIEFLILKKSIDRHNRRIRIIKA